MADDTTIAEILRLEDERIQALLTGDCDKLSTLIAEDLVHYHANGTVDSKATYIESVRSRLDFLAIERSALQVRVYGDTAVVTGPFQQSIRIRASGTVFDLNGIATQIWVKQNGGWVQNTFHACKVG